MAGSHPLGLRIKQISWLVAIWSMSVVALGIFASGFRLIMTWAGLTV